MFNGVVSSMFNGVVSSQESSQYLSHFSLTFIFTPWCAGTEKPTIQQVLFIIFFIIIINNNNDNNNPLSLFIKSTREK